MGEHAKGFWHGIRFGRFGLSCEHGQSLVIVVLAMFVLIGIMAVAVDVATWYQRHHQAQVAADAAALSAANCMANAGVTLATGVNACTTGSDTADATSVATDIGAKNGVTIPSGNVTVNTTSTTGSTGCPATSVCVTAATTSAPFFAGIFGIGTSSQAARAAAYYSAPISQNCTTPSSGACYFAFARDSNCSDTGITLSNNGNVTVTGGIWSNSGLNMSGTDNNSHWGNVTYGQGCTYTPSNKNPKFVSGPSPHAPLSAWPRDYTTVITACGVTGNACNTSGPASGAPSFCTQAQPNFGTSTSSTYSFASGQVYCAYGTGTKSDPSTWNGKIYLAPSTGTYSDTFIGGYVNIASQGSVTISSQLSTAVGNLLVYANDANAQSPTGTSAADVSTQGSATLSGDMFVPNGTLNLSTQGTGTVTTFLEANQMSVSAGGGITGNGPATGTDGQTLAGSDQLTQ